MNEKLRNYIDSLFENAPKTVRAVELKEEMFQNLTDKYNDLISQGKSEEAAYNIAVASIGDVDVLIAGLSGEKPTESVQASRKNGLATAVAVALYITCPVPVILLQNTIGVMLLFVFVAVATGILIYNGVTREKYVKKDDTMVEDFKEWKQNNRQKDQAASALIGSLWLIGVCVYIAVSFMTGAWYITWIIFLITAAVASIIKGIFMLRK
ncbi:MAG TPA: permease prefix domain 1-containing protein [Eubacteriales bacterium]|nr:permease prefix domain 1-containing protein [Eubacteriales bacterium]